MQFDTIDSATDAQGVCTVWLNRPEKHNALSEQMIDELTEMAAILRQGSARVVILAARGKSFCAGGDLQWMQVQMQADRATRQAGARRLAGMLQVWNTLPQPVIGRIHGNAFGGGVGLASICDLAIGVETAAMGLTETKLGLIHRSLCDRAHGRGGSAAGVYVCPQIFRARGAEPGAFGQNRCTRRAGPGRDGGGDTLFKLRAGGRGCGEKIGAGLGSGH